MYIIAIAWLFTAALMTLGQTSVVAGVLTFFFWGLAPLGLLLWLIGTPARLRSKARRQIPEEAGQQCDTATAPGKTVNPAPTAAAQQEESESLAPEALARPDHARSTDVSGPVGMRAAPADRSLRQAAGSGADHRPDPR